MSLPGPPEPCLLVVGLLRSPEVDPQAVTGALAARFGEVVQATQEAPFHFSAYYDREMGPGLLRSFLAIGGRRDPGELSALKLATNALEHAWAGPGGRRVNLDPGLLDLNHLVLATGKPAAHRVYLAGGIYAEVELVFERGSFRPLPWTYADYREPGAVEFFNRLREGHRVARKESR